MKRPPLLELKRITFAYPGSAFRLFDKVDFSLPENQGIGLIGPNGSGKTTLFYIIMGLLAPDSGSIFFQGQMIKTDRDFTRLRRQAGLVFQDADDQLFCPTVLEDVAFGPLNLGLSQEEARDKALRTLNDLELSGLEDRITHQLSGGEKKLVSLATVLAMSPRALLLDEPTNNLDPSTRSKLLDILSSRNEASVIISHDLDFLSRTTDKLLSLENAKLVANERTAIHYHPHIHSHGDKPHHHKS